MYSAHLDELARDEIARVSRVSFESRVFDSHTHTHTQRASNASNVSNLYDSPIDIRTRTRAIIAVINVRDTNVTRTLVLNDFFSLAAPPLPRADRQVQQILGDLFSAGMETVKTTMEWAMLMMLHHPEAAKAVQDELDAVVGRSRMPMLEDFAYLPITEATILEVLRRSNIVPLGTTHATTR